MTDRQARRDPGDPEGPAGETPPGPAPGSGTGGDDTGWERELDAFLGELFPAPGARVARPGPDDGTGRLRPGPAG